MQCLKTMIIAYLKIFVKRKRLPNNKVCSKKILLNIFIETFQLISLNHCQTRT